MKERDFNEEQAFIAVSLAHLLKCALEGDVPEIWHDRAKVALDKYHESRDAEHRAVVSRESA